MQRRKRTLKPRRDRTNCPGPVQRLKQRRNWRQSRKPFGRKLLRRKCPTAPESLAREVVAFTQRLRSMDLFKAPGIAETLDWAEALLALDRIALDPHTVIDTMGVLLKYQDDVRAITREVAEKLVAEVRV